MANIAFLGFGLMLLGVFNAIFFPLYFKNPDKVGVPFLIAAATQFVLIAVLIILRFSVPFFMNVLNTPDPAHMGAKLGTFFLGLAIYVGATGFAAVLSARRFERFDL